MKKSSLFIRTLFFLSFATVLHSAASAQFERARTRLPSSVVTKPSEPVKPATEPTAEKQNLVEAEAIRNVSVVAGVSSAVLTFDARSAGGRPVVEYGSQPPIRGLGGKLEFRHRYDIFKARAIYSDNVLVQPSYKVLFQWLESDTQFYYIITVPGSNGTAERQMQGAFKSRL